MIQSEYMKHSCFLCFWNSRDKKAYFFAVLNKTFKTLRYLPAVRFDGPLQIILGLVKKIFKALNKVIVPQIRKLFANNN